MILALDPSYRATGWAEMEGRLLRNFGVISTAMDVMAKSVMLDNIRRDGAIARCLLGLIPRASAVVAEMPSCGGKSARAIADMARVSGIVTALCHANEVPLIPVSAGQAAALTIG